MLAELVNGFVFVYAPVQCRHSSFWLHIIIILLALRFACLYAALAPTPEFVAINLLYMPFLVMPCFERIMGQAEVGDVQELYDAALKIYQQAH